MLGAGTDSALAAAQTHERLRPLPPTRKAPSSSDSFAVQALPGATTTILGIIRYAQPSDFPDRGVLAADRTVLLSDFAAGLQIDILNARDGDTWTWEFVDPSGAVAATSTLRFLASFLGQTNCFTFGLLGPTLCGDTGITADSATTLVHCGAIGAWKIDLSYNGPLLSAEQFNLKSAGVRAEVTLDPAAINPGVVGGGGIPSIRPGVTNVTVRVSDSDCPDLPVPGATVLLLSETVPGSGGHAHVGNRIGTGTFSAESGTTDRNGLLMGVTYTAGKVGLEEDIIAAPASSGQFLPGRARLLIWIQATGIQLFPLPSSSDYNQAQIDPRPHPLNNFGRSETISALQRVARMYREARQKQTGPATIVKLSFNDLSLPFGRAFDVDQLLNDTKEHFPHRIGNDVDVNSTEVGTGVPLDLRLLDQLVEREFGRRLIEEKKSVHYRFDTILFGP